MNAWLFTTPTSGLHLATLMRALGLVIVLRSLKLAALHIGYMDRTTLLFDYWGWGWLPKLPAWGAQALLVCSALGGLAMLLARSKRASAAGLLVSLASFGYVFLMDKAFFGSLNYAIICLLTSLLLTRAWRIDPHTTHVSRIEALTPRVMLAIVYFYAGLIKLSPDWLGGDVIAAFFEATPPPMFQGLLTSTPVLVTLAVLGAAFDLLVGPLLLVPRTRKIALGLVIIFHGTNMITLDVPEVAFSMLLITLALFAPEEATKKLNQIKEIKENTTHTTSLSTPWRTALAAFLLVQILFPLRPYVDGGGDSRWTHHTQDFSWWLRSTHMSAELKVFVSIDDAPPVKVDVPSYIDIYNQHLFAVDPALITQFAHHVASDYAKTHPDATQISITVQSRASLNRRPMQPFVRGELDLAAEPLRYNMSHLVHPLEPRPKP